MDPILDMICEQLHRVSPGTALRYLDRLREETRVRGARRLEIFICEPWFDFPCGSSVALRAIYGQTPKDMDLAGNLAHHPALRMIHAITEEGTWMREVYVGAGDTYRIHYPDWGRTGLGDAREWGSVEVVPGTLVEVPELTCYEVDRFIRLMDGALDARDIHMLWDLVRECLV